MHFTKFNKRYFKTLNDFFSESKKMKILQKKIKNNRQENKIPENFSEKIMLAVTGVNACIYCSYLHTKTALEKGVNNKEIQKILKGDFKDIPEEELIALLYAQHWTENSGNPSDETRNKVIEYYGLEKTEYIEYYIHRVNIGNLISNTVEAYKKNIIPITGKFNFLLTYLLCAPIAFFINIFGKSMKNTIKNKINYLKNNEL